MSFLNEGTPEDYENVSALSMVFQISSHIIAIGKSVLAHNGSSLKNAVMIASIRVATVRPASVGISR